MKAKPGEGLAAAYLNRLRKDDRELFPEPLQSSALTENDVGDIEKALGYRLPEPYIDFLLSYKLPEQLTVSARFCGGYAACYEPDNEEDLFATLKTEWYTGLSGGVKEFLSAVSAGDMLLGETDDTFLDAGFIRIAEFEGYFVFLDLVTGEVVHIYHEAIYDMSIVDKVNVSDYREVREYLSDFTLCGSFYDFLRLVCTKDIYDEVSMEFKTTEMIQKELSEYKPPSIEEQNEVKERAVRQVMAEEKVTREEAIRYLAELVQISEEEFKEGLE